MKNAIWALLAACGTLTACATRAQDAPANLENGYVLQAPQKGVRVVLDENGAWGGNQAGSTHQNGADYRIEKTLEVPAGALAGAKEARLRVFMSVLDYSNGGDAAKPSNGLDETFDLVVNGQSETVRTDAGFSSRATPNESLLYSWHDFVIPLARLKAGANTFSIHKSAGTKNDDYLYIGIDNSIERGHSRSSMDGGKTWSHVLNTLNTRGEYMMRLLLLDTETKADAVWTPKDVRDGGHLFGYAAREKSDTLRLELDAAKIDRSAPSRLTINFAGAPPQVESANFTLPAPTASTRSLTYRFAAGAVPRLLEIKGDVTSARFDYKRDPYPMEAAAASVDLAPRVLAARGKAAARVPAARLTDDGFIVENALLQARFSTKAGLQMQSLRHELLNRNVLANPALTKLFLLEIGGKRYGAADWQVKKVTLLKSGTLQKSGASTRGVAVDLFLPSQSLAARFTIFAEKDALRFGLNVANKSTDSRTWKTAFPHLAGIELSDKAEDDAYLFPYKGGIIGPLDANLRTAYGEDSAWWQMIDVFSPTGGAGFSVRADDAKGMYKAPALRKGIAPRAGAQVTTIGNGTAPELLWKDSLESAPGLAVTLEYLARTRAAGKSFAPPDAVLFAHDGDWKNAMREYSQWAHTTWKWRRFSSHLDDVWNIGTIGWGANRKLAGGEFFEPAIFRNGKFRTDFLDPNNDAIEPYGWWEWADKGPWGVPLRPVEELKSALGEPFYGFINPYIGVDGATQDIGYSQNMGDYKYHASWGGLPAFRAYLADLKKRGHAPLLYTCPILVDANSEMGKKYGAKYGVINPLISPGAPAPKNTPKDYVGAYGSYNMCFDNADYPPIAAQQIARILADTGADGLRMDVLGNPNFACSNPLHKHLYAEAGHNEYLRGSARFAALTRAAVDKSAPGAALTSEFPGYDFLFHNLDGALVYESSWNLSQVQTLRPLPVNLLRFYFPEFKTFDIDELEPTARIAGSTAFRFWNGIAAFGTTYAPREHQILKDNGDAFNAPNAQPLIDTLLPRVYANRFASGDKTLFTIINRSEFTVNEPLLALPLRADQRVFDLTNGREIVPEKRGVALQLRPREAACLARFSRVLATPQRTAEGWKIALPESKIERRLSLCAADGAIIKTQNVTSGGTQILIDDAKTPAIYVKLFAGKYLTDAAELPR